MGKCKMFLAGEYKICFDQQKKTDENDVQYVADPERVSKGRYCGRVSIPA